MTDFEEKHRLAALRELDLLDTAPSESFDRITRLACHLFDLPMAAISLTDTNRQWFKSRVGLSASAIPREKAPCAEVAASTESRVFRDLSKEARYADSPIAAAGARFYAGAPLVTRSGFGLGALCVLDLEPRSFTPEQMGLLKDLAAMVMTQIKLQHNFSRVDPLSGLPNRHQFYDDVEALRHHGTVTADQVAIVADLARIEQIGDMQRILGPVWLDERVREAAQSLRSILAPAKAYHVGRMEFAFLPASSDAASIEALCGRIRMELGRSARSGGHRLITAIAFGMVPLRLAESTLPKTPASPQDILRAASSAAEDGHETIGTYCEARDAAHRRRFTLLNDFADALEGEDQIRLVYQPRIDLRSGRCQGAEALLRWTHPRLGAIAPDEFIPLIERTALARGTTAFVIERALGQLAAWRRTGYDLRLSLNLSAANLEEDDFVDRLDGSLRRHGIAPGVLELELTESAIMRDAERALPQLAALAALGVRIAIDDFGTGYSSLSYLQRIPARVVKIDRSFMCDLAQDARRRALVSAMIKLAQDLGYRVVGEGVETDEVATLLAGYGCDEVQGYFFARPLEPDGFEAWFETWLGAAVARGGGPVWGCDRSAP